MEGGPWTLDDVDTRGHTWVAGVAGGRVAAELLTFDGASERWLVLAGSGGVETRLGIAGVPGGR